MRSLLHAIMKIQIFPAVLLLVMVTAVNAQEPRIQISQLDHLAAKASDTIDVNVDERLIKLAAKFFDDKDADQAAIKKLIIGLKGIYVKSFEFDADNVYSTADLDMIRNQLREPTWSRLLNVTSRKEGNVEVYVAMTGTDITGLTVLSSEPRELTIINIVGPVDLEKLAQLEGNLGIPELGIKTGKKKNDEDDK